MSQFDSLNSLFGYYSRFQRARGNFGGLPAWARAVVFATALPGILLLALSILLVGVSILALLLLTVPTYALLRRLTGSDGAGGVQPTDPADGLVIESGGFGQPGRKRVDATVVDPPGP